VRESAVGSTSSGVTIVAPLAIAQASPVEPALA